MSELELEQLEVLLDKFNRTYHKDYPISCEGVEQTIYTIRDIKDERDGQN